MSSSFGQMFRVTTCGESHGKAVVAIVDGCPARVPVDEGAIQRQLDRRRPGQSDLTTPRGEPDRVTVLSGIQNGMTLGTPIGLSVSNQDTRPEDYGAVRQAPRPSHADYTYWMKYGIRSVSGGGRASARETVARVASGAVAEQFLRHRWGVEIVAWVSAVGDIVAPDLTGQPPTREEVDRMLTRCPHAEASTRIEAAIRAARDDGDSMGGVITCVCRGMPPGWGEPVFDKVGALMGHAMLSIPAVKGFEIGSGFAGTLLRGSQHNDRFEVRARGETPADLRLGTVTNRSGGTQGGITNGEPVVFRVAFKPVATIGKAQDGVDYDGNPVTLAVKGRHDPCVLPRAVAIVESMAALTLAELGLRAGRHA